MLSKAADADSTADKITGPANSTAKPRMSSVLSQPQSLVVKEQVRPRKEEK